MDKEKGKERNEGGKERGRKITVMAETEKQRYTDVLVYLLHHYSMPQGECLKQQKYICCTIEG